MSDGAFNLKIFTPAGLALEDQANQVAMPSVQGEIGILPGHIRYTGLLGTGILEYYSVEARQPVRLVIQGGFCSFAEQELTLLADSVALADSVEDSYAENRSELTEALKDRDTRGAEWQQARRQLDRIEAIDQLVSH